MPRNLQPDLVAFPLSLVRGRIIALRDRTNTGPADVLTFQYNPETVTRSRTGEWTKKRDRTGRAANPDLPSNQARGRADATRGGGLYAKSETVSFKLVFDATELQLREMPGAPSEGVHAVPEPVDILPELAFLERLALGGDKAMDRKSRTLGSARGRGQPRPITASAPAEVLVELGGRRFPAVMTTLTITEKRFNWKFNPTFAECDVKFRVLEAGEVYGSLPIQTNFQELLRQRETRAQDAASTVQVETLIVGGDTGGGS